MAKSKNDGDTPATTATSATRSANEWGIPDWRDTDFYRGLAKWEPNRWQWEFLRRREDYRRDFDAAVCELDRVERRFEHIGADKYGLEEFFDPKISDWTGYYGPMWHPLPLPSIDEDGFTALKPGWVEIAFDISKPLEPQLRAAKDELETAQSLEQLSDTEAMQLAYGAEYSGQPEIPSDIIEAKLGKRLRAPKHHTEKWPAYLRVLDARAANATWAEITNAFFADGLLDRRKSVSGGYEPPPPQAAQNLWKQAKALRF